jgi:hypothetical protein
MKKRKGEGPEEKSHVPHGSWCGPDIGFFLSVASLWNTALPGRCKRKNVEKTGGNMLLSAPK